MHIFFIALLPTIASFSLIGYLKNIFAFFIVYQLLICLITPVLKLRLANKYGFRESFNYLGLYPPNLNKTMIGLGASVFFFVVLFVSLFISNQLSLLETESFASSLSSRGVVLGLLPLMFLFMFIVNAFAEEVFWRGFVSEEFKSYFTASKANSRKHYVFNSLFYAMYHLPILILFVQDVVFVTVALLSIFSAGLVWTYFREMFQTTWISVFGHYGATFAYMVFLYLCSGLPPASAVP